MEPFLVYQIITLGLGFWTWNLLGQGVLFLLAGSTRETNAIYRLIRGFNKPVFWVARKVTFGSVAGPPLGFIALFLTLLARAVVYTVFSYFDLMPDFPAPPNP